MTSMHMDAERQQAIEIKTFTQDWCDKDDRIASLSYFGTFAVYFLTLWLAIEAAFAAAWWAVVPLVVINAFAGVRLYVLQHDCGHHSLFSTKLRNELAGYGLSTFTLTPFRAMQVNHNDHHAHISDLDARETTEIYTMTVKEWEEAGFWQRLGYRLYRNPLFMLPVGGAFTYLIRYRWPKNAAKIGGWEVMVQNVAVAVWVGLIWALAGWTGIWIWLATAVVAGIIGVFLVYLQHNFEDAYWDRRPELRFDRAALQGASCLDLGWWWDLGTGNIAYHDIHHFNARIPSYRLRQCHFALREHYDIHTVRWPQAFKAFTLKLWDEETERLVPFPKAKKPAPEAMPAE